MSSASFYKWRAKHGGMDVSSMKRLKEFEGYLKCGLPHYSLYPRLVRNLANRSSMTHLGISERPGKTIV
jgi:hypothetical protein